jgi:hypothetical protein
MEYNRSSGISWKNVAENEARYSEYDYLICHSLLELGSASRCCYEYTVKGKKVKLSLCLTN